MPWRPAPGAAGPDLPRAVTPLECAPRAIDVAVGGRSTSTQWKKSTRGSDAGTTRPSWLTSSPREGTSGSWQTSANERVPAGAPLHAKSGFRFCDSATCVAGSMRPNANSGGIAPPSANAVVASFMGSGLLRFRWARRCAGGPMGSRHGFERGLLQLERANAHLHHVVAHREPA